MGLNSSGRRAHPHVERVGILPQPCVSASSIDTDREVTDEAGPAKRRFELDVAQPLQPRVVALARTSFTTGGEPRNARAVRPPVTGGPALPRKAIALRQRAERRISLQQFAFLTDIGDEPVVMASLLGTGEQRFQGSRFQRPDARTVNQAICVEGLRFFCQRGRLGEVGGARDLLHPDVKRVEKTTGTREIRTGFGYWPWRGGVQGVQQDEACSTVRRPSHEASEVGKVAYTPA